MHPSRLLAKYTENLAIIYEFLSSLPLRTPKHLICGFQNSSCVGVTVHKQHFQSGDWMTDVTNHHSANFKYAICSSPSADMQTQNQLFASIPASRLSHLSACRKGMWNKQVQSVLFFELERMFTGENFSCSPSPRSPTGPCGIGPAAFPQAVLELYLLGTMWWFLFYGLLQHWKLCLGIEFPLWAMASLSKDFRIWLVTLTRVNSANSCALYFPQTV